jgi:hypothetical protein
MRVPIAKMRPQESSACLAISMEAEVSNSLAFQGSKSKRGSVGAGVADYHAPATLPDAPQNGKDTGLNRTANEARASAPARFPTRRFPCG